jgi:hypothetical protein
VSALTPRGWFVLGIVATMALWLLVLVSSSLWWVGIDSPKAEFSWLVLGINDGVRESLEVNYLAPLRGGAWWSAAKCGRGRERERSP